MTEKTEAAKVALELEETFHKDEADADACQNPRCVLRRKAIKVCHHSDCQDANHHRPFRLCLECDLEIHGKKSLKGHLVFDIAKKAGQLTAGGSFVVEKDRHRSYHGKECRSSDKSQKSRSNGDLLIGGDKKGRYSSDRTRNSAGDNDLPVSDYGREHGSSIARKSTSDRDERNSNSGKEYSSSSNNTGKVTLDDYLHKFNGRTEFYGSVKTRRSTTSDELLHRNDGNECKGSNRSKSNDRKGDHHCWDDKTLIQNVAGATVAQECCLSDLQQKMSPVHRVELKQGKGQKPDDNHRFTPDYFGDQDQQGDYFIKEKNSDSLKEWVSDKSDIKERSLIDSRVHFNEDVDNPRSTEGVDLRDREHGADQSCPAKKYTIEEAEYISIERNPPQKTYDRIESSEGCSFNYPIETTTGESEKVDHYSFSFENVICDRPADHMRFFDLCGDGIQEGCSDKRDRCHDNHNEDAQSFGGHRDNDVQSVDQLAQSDQDDKPKIHQNVITMTDYSLPDKYSSLSLSKGSRWGDLDHSGRIESGFTSGPESMEGSDTNQKLRRQKAMKIKKSKFRESLFTSAEKIQHDDDTGRPASAVFHDDSWRTQSVGDEFKTGACSTPVTGTFSPVYQKISEEESFDSADSVYSQSSGSFQKTVDENTSARNDRSQLFHSSTSSLGPPIKSNKATSQVKRKSFYEDVLQNAEISSTNATSAEYSPAFAERGTSVESVPASVSSYSTDSLSLNRLFKSKQSNFSQNAKKPPISGFSSRSSLMQREDVPKKHFRSKGHASSKLPVTFLRKFSLTTEYFNLQYEGSILEIAAPKGLSLEQALAPFVVERWGLSLDRCEVFLSSSNSALPLSSDCSLLANHTLHLKVKGDEKQGTAGRPPADVISSADEAKQNENVRTSKKNLSPAEDSISADPMGSCSTLSQTDLQRLRSAKSPSKLQSLFLFSKTQDKNEQLQELLNSYSVNGLPKMPDLLTLGRPQYDQSLFHLEHHWKDIVDNHELLTKQQRNQQEAIWELLTTEMEYIRKIRVLIDVFMCCLFNLQNEQLLNEIEADKLFSNIDDVYFATCHFWNVHMSQVARQARETREPLNPSLLKSGFLVFDKIFEPYIKYCLEQDTCQEYIKSKAKENELFRTYIQWGQRQKQCQLLRLQDIVCGPWQRLMRYRLLLKQIHKHTLQISNPQQNDQVNDLDEMIEQVERFVMEVNVAMRQREESRQLSRLMNRIESYDAVEAPNDECIKLLEKFSKLDLISPVAGCGIREMRMLIMEGSLKLKDTFSKTDVYCFLFTDLFLITKPLTKRGTGDKIRIIKPPMRLDKIVIHSLRDPASFAVLYLNEYHVAQAIYTFTGEAKAWVENMTKTQNDYMNKRYQYIIQPEFTFADINDNEGDYYPTFTESHSTLDLTRDFDSASRSSSSTESFLPKYASEISLATIADPGNSNLQQMKKKGLMSSVDPRLHISCDELHPSRRDAYEFPYGTKTRLLSPGSAFPLDVKSDRYVRNCEFQNVDEKKLQNCDGLINKRRCDGSIHGRELKDQSREKRLSWNYETSKAPDLDARLYANRASKSAQPRDSRRSVMDNYTQLPEHRATDVPGVAPSSSFVDPRSQNCSDSSSDVSMTTGWIRPSVSMPAFPKLTVTNCSDVGAAELGNKHPVSEKQHRHPLGAAAYLVEECTLESSDV